MEKGGSEKRKRKRRRGRGEFFEGKGQRSHAAAGLFRHPPLFLPPAGRRIVWPSSLSQDSVTAQAPPGRRFSWARPPSGAGGGPRRPRTVALSKGPGSLTAAFESISGPPSIRRTKKERERADLRLDCPDELAGVLDARRRHVADAEQVDARPARAWAWRARARGRGKGEDKALGGRVNESAAAAAAIEAASNWDPG